MDIKLERYKIFCTVVESGSFSAAAEKLYVTQSAVSQSIRSLEESLGATLFVRKKSGVTPTSMGTLLYDYAAGALSLLNAAERKFGAYSSLSSGELSLGASDTICRHVLLPILKTFHDRYPAVRLSVSNRVTSEGVNDLQTGKTEIAFVNLPYPPLFEDSGIGCEKAIPLHDIFVASEDFRIPRGKKYDWKEIAELPLVMLEKRSNSRCRVDEFFAAHGIRLSPEFELGSHELLLAFAQAGLGVACVTKEFSEDVLNTGKLKILPTKGQLPERNVGILTLSHSPLSAASRAFLEIFREQYAEHEKK
ncbi:MAG: LysR family transcriptional regulator [Clostridia bacterium]|nr:LysR family transcriptional regulator [Clostridia bacterium]